MLKYYIIINKIYIFSEKRKMRIVLGVVLTKA